MPIACMAKTCSTGAVLDKLYSAPVFDKAMIRALANQHRHGSSRGTEVEALNVTLIETLRDRLGADDGARAIAAYAAYLNRRSGSYMKLESPTQKSCGSAWRVFCATTASAVRHDASSIAGLSAFLW